MALTPSAGRPRSGPRRRRGATPREEILDAAAELFTTQGYAATSTRAIAEAVGVKQASLYYHFANKEQILFELLLPTVQPSRAVAARLAADGRDDPRLGPAVQLWVLAAYDAGLLCSSRWNLGALYLLPELRVERFADFHAERGRLREDYAGLVERGVAEGVFGVADVTAAAQLAFGLVETVISLRQDPEAAARLVADPAGFAVGVADGVLRLLGSSEQRLRGVRSRGRAWLDRHAPTPAVVAGDDDASAAAS